MDKMKPEELSKLITEAAGQAKEIAVQVELRCGEVFNATVTGGRLALGDECILLYADQDDDE